MAHHLHRNTSPPPCFLRLPSPALRLSLLLLITLALLYAFSVFLLNPSSFSRRLLPPPPPCGVAAADLSAGRWARAHPRLLYDGSCPFHRNAWNCLRNEREGMDSINSWVWLPDRCGGQPIPRIDPAAFLGSMRGRKIGFVGDSLNENFLVALLCTLRSADGGAKKWKRKGAWRGGYFPKFDAVVAYHRAVLLAKYTWQPVDNSAHLGQDGVKGTYKVDIDVPADDWANVTKFYDVLIFNTGHWSLDLTHMSEFRADAHPAIWLGKKDAVAIWGQDCMHWCLPGLPDIWVDILAAQIIYNLELD
ncbi:hypothetical protein BHM03_00056071 [Ensete ventricosum]|nr:hypothetical protein BHM03_00056071 [Ensete ventricosum]